MNHNIQQCLRDFRQLKVDQDKYGAANVAFERGMRIGIAIGIESDPNIPAWEVHYLRNIREHWRHGL
jgi:hypothetical protein